MKASALIRSVVSDARSLDHKTYTPDSQKWHRPFANGLPCQVCFAGAWLAQQFKPQQEIDIDDLNSEQAHTCHFLDRIRRRRFDGIRIFAHGAGIDEPRQVEQQLNRLHREVPGFLQLGPRHFHTWDTFEEFLVTMDMLAKELERHNL